MVDIPGAPITNNPEEDRFHAIQLDELALHHAFLCDALQEVADGTVKNLMVLMPPGSAKSTYVSVVFPAWLMGWKPRTQIILGCYGSDLARKQGRRARQLVKSPGYCALFEAELSKDSSAADEWSLTNGSEYMAGGILSGMTGNRANGIIVDDPIRGREDAESETIRRKTSDAIQDDMRTRLKPHGWQIMVTTRWHQDDPAGATLPEDWAGESGDIQCRDGQVWRVICIPAKADRADDPLGRKVGEYLWPEWFPRDHWKPFESNARTWSSLYQGKPAPEEGTFFQKGWFGRHAYQDPKAAKIGRHVYITSDFAVTDQGGDFTEIGVWGYGSDDVIRQLDWWYGQTSSDVWIEEVIDRIKRWSPMCFFGEAGVIEKAIRPALIRRMRERQVNCRMEWVSSIADKASRARPLQARAAMGKVSLLNDASGDRLLNQLLTFPAGRYDDAVDTATMMGLVIDNAHPGIAVVKAAPKAKDHWDNEDERESADWKAS